MRNTASGITNFGTSQTLLVRGGNASQIFRMILSFDLTGIPTGAKVEDATVSIFRTATSARTIDFHRVTNSWLEGTAAGLQNNASRNGVTWLERQYGDNAWTGSGPWDWSTQGGDYAVTPSATLALPAGTTGFFDFNVSSDIQAFVDGAYANNGWVVKDNSEVGATSRTNTFASNNYGTVANRPKIAIAYIIGDTTITPNSAYANASTGFTVRLSNNGGANGDQMNEATFTVPAGFTAISSAAASAAAFGKNWTITTQPGASGPTVVKATAASAADDLTDGQYVDVTFTATAPSSPGLTTWDSGIKGAAGGWYNDPTPATVAISAAADTTPPVTTLATLPLTPDGDAGWFKTNPAITLTRDEPGSTYYKWGSAGTTQTYSAAFSGLEGENTLYYWSSDSANNTETANTQAIKVDTTAPDDPTSVSSSSHTTGTPSMSQNIAIDFTGATDTASGVEGYSISWSSGATATPPATLNTSASVSTTTSPSLTPDGAWWFNLRTKDTAGNWTSSVHMGPFDIDTAAPVTTFSTVPAAPDGSGGWFVTNPTISLSKGEAGATYYQWDSTSGPWTTYGASFSALEGAHTLYYYSVDTAGNTETTSNVLIKADSGLPADPDLSSPTHVAGTLSNNPAVTVDLSGATDTASGVSGYSISWTNSSSSLPDTTVDMPVSENSTTSAPLADGTWYAHLRTVDVAGNWTSTVHLGPFDIDTTDPTVDSVSPTAGQTDVAIAGNVVAIFSEAMDTDTINGATFTLKDASDTPVAATVTYNAGPKTATLYPDGNLDYSRTYTATLSTSVKDVAGNALASPYTFSFTTIAAADTTPPVTTLSSTPGAPNGEAGWFTTTPDITLSRSEAGSTYYKWGSAGTTETYSTSFPAQEGENTLWYWSVDSANNTETANTQAIKVDTTAPDDPTSVSSSSHTTGTPSMSQNIAIDFTGATDTASGVEGYSISWSSGATATPPATLNTSASVSTTTSPSLTPDGAWWFNLRTKDTAGNWTSSVHMGPFDIDTSLPSVTTATPTNGATGVAVNIDATAVFSEDMDAATINSTNFTLEDASGTPVAASVSYNAGTKTATLNPSGDLNNSTVYTATLSTSVKDVAGNALASPYTFSFTTIAAADTTPPVTTLSSTPGAPNGEAGWFTTTPDITLSRSEAGVTYYQWDSTTGVWTTYGAPFSALEGSHTLYHYSVDGANNTETIQSVPTKVDTIAPADPTLSSPSHTVGESSTNQAVTVDLAGAADTGSGVAGYSISWTNSSSSLPDAIMDLAAPAASTSSGNLAAGTWYMHLRTKDTAGNWTSTAHLGPFVIDTEPPTVASTNPANSTMGAGVSGDITAIFSEYMDASTINGTNIYLEDASSNPVPASVTFIAWKKTAILNPDDDLAFSSNYTGTITTGVKDEAGNALASPYTFSFTTISEASGTPSHGGYSTTSNKCKNCHSVHLAEGQWRQLGPGATDASTACEYCHGAAGIVATKKVWLDANGHGLSAEQTGDVAVPDDTTYTAFRNDVWGCSVCHSTHGAGSVVLSEEPGITTSKLLRKFPNVNKPAGNAYYTGTTGTLNMSAWCSNCHEANFGSHADAKSTPAGTRYGHDSSSAGYQLSGGWVLVAPDDSTNTGPTCSQCHTADRAPSGISQGFPHAGGDSWKMLKSSSSTGTPGPIEANKLDKLCATEPCHKTEDLF